MSSDYVRMTLKEVLVRFNASGPQQMNSAPDEMRGPNGYVDRYEATIAKDTTIIMDVTTDRVELSVHDEFGDMLQSWTLTLERKA